MTFCEQLNEYIKQIDCSSQELVDGLYKLFKDKKLNITRDEIIDWINL